ncbi:mechanosensitive ion channel family protein [Roseibium sp.]|uniref:mechanosensitive ion channel family protein n=1 Tax=Roseibium sp. TaxID=1936156 RepID=UPI003B50C173
MGDLVLNIQLEYLLWIAVVLIVVISRSWLARGCVVILSRVARQFDLTLSDPAKQRLAGPMSLLLVNTALLFAFTVLKISGPYSAVLLRLLQTTTVLSLFVVIYASALLVAENLNQRLSADRVAQNNWLAQIVRFIVVFLAFVVALKIWGVDLGPALTGLGLAGAAVAFAAQDLIQNLIAGFTNNGERRFRAGDWIRLEDGTEGTVEKIDLRSTTIRRFDKAPIHIPNAKLAGSSLTNFAQRPMRRIKWEIDLTYQTKPEVIEEICIAIRTYVGATEGFAQPTQVPVSVFAHSFKESSICILIDCFVIGTDREAYRKACHHLLLEVMRIVEQNGSSFAYPTRSLYMETTE